MNWQIHRRPHHIILTVGDFAVELLAQRTIRMANTINVGQTLPLSIEYLDQNGQPMATAPTPDATPAWANSNPAAGALTAAPDGLSATELGVAAGLDTVQLTVTVGGKLFTATLDVTVDAVVAQQTLTTIAIVPGTPTP